MKFRIQHSLLLSLSVLSFSVTAHPGERPYDAAHLHLVRRDSWNATSRTSGVSTGQIIPSASMASLPRRSSVWPTTTNPPPITSAPVSSSSSVPTTSSSAPPATTTVSDGNTISVPAGVVVVGGIGGGFFAVAGSGAAPVPVAAGSTVTAGSEGTNIPDDPDNPDIPEQETTALPETSEPPASAEPTSTEPPTSAEPTTTEPPTSTQSTSTQSSSTQSTSTQRTSSAPIGTPTPCLIFPKDDATTEDNEEFLSLLEEELGTGNFWANTDTEQLFVSANITAAQNATLLADPLVGGVEPNVPLDDNVEEAVPVADSKRDEDEDEDVHEKWWMESLDKLGNIQKRAVVKQRHARTELVMLSTPPEQDPLKLKKYSYDESAGANITVYILDSGYYRYTSEYVSMATQPRWLFAGTQANKGVKEDLHKDGHGTCGGSKINGRDYGVAKQANLVIVKAAEDVDETLDGFGKILKDVRARKLQGKAVVNFSRSIPNPGRLTKSILEHYLTKLIEEDVVVVSTAGNGGRIDQAVEVNRYPALFAAKGMPIIVVGAVDNWGRNATFSQGGPLVSVMAPGHNIECASNRFPGKQIQSGTSFAAPAVSGLAAYLLALGEHPELQRKGRVARNMKRLLMHMAYPRIAGGGQVVFNGQGAICSRPSSAKFRRQELELDLSGEACSAVSSSTILPATSTAGPSPPATTATSPATETAGPSPPATTATSPATETAVAPPPATTTATTTSAETTAPPLPATTTSSPPTETTAASVPNTLFTLNEEVVSGATECFPMIGWAPTADTTYGFSFEVDDNLLVSIKTGSTGTDTPTEEGYHYGMGSWSGTLNPRIRGSSMEICGTSAPGTSGNLALNFTITEEPNEVVAAAPGNEIYRLERTAEALATSCFPTFLNNQVANHGFTYETVDGVIISIGDTSDGPRYFRGNREQGVGLMYLDFLGGTLWVCATNNGIADAPITLSLTL